MAKNTHNVPKKRWNKWNKNEQAMFNRMWTNLDTGTLNSIGIPRELLCNLKSFYAIRRNLCWIVADIMKDWRGYWNEKDC